MPLRVRNMTHSRTTVPSLLSDEEDDILADFLLKKGLGYRRLHATNQNLYFTEDAKELLVQWFSSVNDNDDRSYWTRSWDDLIENKSTGKALLAYIVGKKYSCHA